jgi:hypothetical protein
MDGRRGGRINCARLPISVNISGIGNGRDRMSIRPLTLLAIALLIVYAQNGLAQSEELPEYDTPCQVPQSQTSHSEVTVAELNFQGDLRLATAEDQIARKLNKAAYSGDPTEELVERLRLAWEDHGYFRVQVQGDSRTLSSNPINKRIGVTFQIDEEPQYRLGQITLKGNKAIMNTAALRELFAIKDGDVFNLGVIAKGLENLQKAYGQYGYINFKSVPETIINETDQTISLIVDIDEGKQFFISSINILGLDGLGSEQVLKFLQKPGDIYNQRLVDLSMKRLSTPSVALETERRLDEKAGTVAITISFKRCPLH